MKPTILAVVMTLTAPPLHAEPPRDTRVAAAFPPAIKLALYARMRDNLAALQAIQQALAQNDFANAAEVAETRLGISSLGPHNARQQPFMPEPMQHLGMSMHRAATDFAVVAQERDMSKALAALAKTTALCVACHASYRAK